MKKIVFFTLLIFALLTINGLLRSIISLWQKQDVIVKTQQELRNVQAENRKLKQEATRVKDPAFVEQEARNKLFFAKPGEKVVIIPSLATPTPPLHTKKNTQALPSWQQWLQLFF